MNVWEWSEVPPTQFAVLGDPIAHSRSPRMFAAALGEPDHYVAIRVSMEELPNALPYLGSLGFQGVNITVPLKEAAFKLCKVTDEASLHIGAVNTVKPGTMEATNTDWIGFTRWWQELGHPAGVPTLVLGAGGSARAVLLALHRLGVETAIWNRTPERAQDLVDTLEVRATVLAEPDATHFGIVVNTTSAHLFGEGPPVIWGTSGLAMDLATEPFTPFLLAAGDRGYETSHGLEMLVHQGHAAYEWWTGKTLDLDLMRRGAASH